MAITSNRQQLLPRFKEPSMPLIFSPVGLLIPQKLLITPDDPIYENTDISGARPPKYSPDELNV